MPLQKLRVPSRDGWTALIDSWGALLDRYEKIAVDDVAYWHGENSLTASLASAAWLVNGVALVEFETKRTRRLPEQSGSGAGDAYLWIGAIWYTVEAKLCWYLDDVDTSMEAARTNLRTIRPEDRAGAGVALCYLMLEVRRESQAPLIEAAGRELLQHPGLDLLITYTPLAKQAPEWEGKSYPGMIVIGQIVEWEPQS